MQLDSCIHGMASFKQHIKLLNLSNVYNKMWKEFGFALWSCSSEKKTVLLVNFFEVP